jgi:hypothetical protein
MKEIELIKKKIKEQKIDYDYYENKIFVKKRKESRFCIKTIKSKFIIDLELYEAIFEDGFYIKDYRYLFSSNYNIGDEESKLDAFKELWLFIDENLNY